MTFNLNGNHWANSDNMGKRLLVKAGWSSGEGVGKDKQGTNVHIKVSIKNEKQGLGMKADKRQSGANLMQCFQFDHLLKTKYGKTTEDVVPPVDYERSMSRSRFGRAVPRDFFKPVDQNQWNKILCSSESTQPDKCKTEPIFNEIQTPDRDNSNANFTSSKTIYEYFSSKMAGSNGVTGIGSLQEFLRARDKGHHPEVSKAAYDQKIPDESEDVPKKKSKRKLSNNETTDPVVISIEIEVGGDRRKSKETQDAGKVVEIERCERVKKSKKDQKQGRNNEEVLTVVEEDTDVINEKKTRKRKTSHKEDEVEIKIKRKKHEVQTVEAGQEVQIEVDGEPVKKKRIKEHQNNQKSDFKKGDNSTLEDDGVNDREGRKSIEGTKKEDFEGDAKIEKKKSKKQKNRISFHEELHIPEQLSPTETKLEFEVDVQKSAPRESQKKRKSKNVDKSAACGNDVSKNVESTNTKLKVSDSIETTQSIDIIDSERTPCESLPSQVSSARKSVVADLTELMELPVIDPWTTSSIDIIEGYRYY